MHYFDFTDPSECELVPLKALAFYFEHRKSCQCLNCGHFKIPEKSNTAKANYHYSLMKSEKKNCSMYFDLNPHKSKYVLKRNETLRAPIVL